MDLKEKLQQLDSEKVTILGVPLVVRELNAEEWVKVEDSLARDDAGEVERSDLLVRLVVACTTREDGSPAFTEEDLGWLRTKAKGQSVKKLYAAAAKLNGIAGDSEKN